MFRAGADDGWQRDGAGGGRGRVSLERSVRRLARMSPHEVYTRARQEAARRRDVLLFRLGLDPCPAPGKALDARGPFYLDAAEIPEVAAFLRRRMPENAEAIVARARRILDRRFDLLGFSELDFGKDIDWGLDPVHGLRASPAPWPAIPYLDFEAVGDHKIVWELNRHQFLVTLAKAYRLTGEERFAGAIEELWRDWRRKNSYPLGINWTSTLEVAFRAIAWTWTAFLLEGSACVTPEFQREISVALAQAGWYIQRFLSTYFSPNTHLLGEGAALFLIGVRYPGLRHAAAWRESGWSVIQEAARKQVLADGWYFEQSTYYHVYALDFFLHSRILAARNGISIPGELDGTIRKMLDALERLSRAGAAPRYGDDDGGRLFDASRNRAEHLLDPLSTGCALFGETEWKSAAGSLREETVWLLGTEGAGAFDAVPPRATTPSTAELPEAGIYAMGPAGAPPAQVFIDCGRLGAGAAGHGHADALSVQLAAGGELWLSDPGACRYVGGKVRRKFRGTAAHNTMTVDGLDQAEAGGPFSWISLPRVETLRWVKGKSCDLFEGRHFGYERLPDPLIHRRWVWRIGEGFWLIRDVAEGRGAHKLGIRWGFAPGIEASAAGDTVMALRNGFALSVAGAGGPGWRASLAEDEYSPAYGASVQASAAIWSYEGECPAEFASALRFGPPGDNPALARRDDGAEGVSVYEFSGAQDHRWFFFATDGRPWRFGPWASDAAAVSVGNRRQVILAGGSYLEYDGRRVVEAPGKLSLVECGLSGPDVAAPPDPEARP